VFGVNLAQVNGNVVLPQGVVLENLGILENGPFSPLIAQFVGVNFFLQSQPGVPAGTFGPGCIGGVVATAPSCIFPTVGPGGLALANSTVSGAIINAGTITGATQFFMTGNPGVLTPAGGTIATDGITLTNVVAGGITNSGQIAAANGTGMFVVARPAVGILLTSSTVNGTVLNSGTLTAVTSLGPAIGIQVDGASAVNGSIINTGMISVSAPAGVGAVGILVQGTVTGGIINTGTIIGGTAAIDLTQELAPTTIVQAGGMIQGAIKLSANADVLNISGGTLNGSITSLGTTSALNLNGGLVLLAGTNSIGTATLTGGVLEVGNAANSNTALTLLGGTPLAVNGGTLEGHGTIVGGVNVGNGGTLLPGGSVGTLTINGNLAFQPGSTYAITLSPSRNSQTIVNGAVTINGGTVVDNPQFGLYKPATITILTSSGALTGTFNPTVASATSFGLFGAKLSYDAHDVFLSYTGAGFILPANAPLNAQNAVGAINTALAANGTLPAPFLKLAGLSGNALSTAANQLGGQVQGSFAPVGFQAGDMFLKLLLNPHLDGRNGVTNAGVPLAYASQPTAPAAFSALSLGPGAVFAPNMSFWAAAYGGDATIQGNAFTGAATTSSQIYGLATGLDYRLSPDTVVGFALGGGGTAWQLGQGMGAGHSGMFQSGVYGTRNFGSAYVSGAAAYSLQEVTTNRNVTLAGFDSLQGNFAANVVSARLESGYRLSYGAVAVTPYGALQTQEMFLPAYSEFATVGASQFALNYASRDFNATRTELGAWFDSNSFANGWAQKGLTLYGRAAWAHDFDNEGAATAVFQSLPGTSFTINSAKPAHDGALVTVGFQYKLQDGWSVLAKFDGEFSSTTAIFAGTATLRYLW
jgi:uncharacterized protein with beta-barrel porin domain